jgi:group I intron endonuclease
MNFSVELKYLLKGKGSYLTKWHIKRKERPVYKIYQIKNIINKKCYIGMTKQKLEYRVNCHFSKRTIHNNLIYPAFLKYGKETFKITILAECLILSDAKEAERLLIIQENTIAPYGYNLRQGGDHPGPLSEISRQRLSLKMKNRKVSNITRAKQSMSGKKVIRTEEWRFNNSVGQKERKSNLKIKNKITGYIYKNLNEFRHKENISNSKAKTLLDKRKNKNGVYEYVR